MHCQEFPLLIVPYETLYRKYRLGQRIIDKEVSGINKFIKETDSDGKNKLEGIKSKLQKLRSQLNDIHKSETDECTLLSHRLDHLSKIKSNQHSWQYIRFHRQLTDFLFQQGFQKSGALLAENLEIEKLINSKLYLQIIELEESLIAKDTQKSLNWCNQNKTKLQKIKSRFEWDLRIQDFVELIKVEKRIEAVQYARKYLTPLSPSDEELGQVMALLVFPSSTHISRYKNLFSDDRWLLLRHMCRYDMLRSHSLGEHSVFEKTLEAGLSAMKTHQCFLDKTKSNGCPVCSEKLNGVASKLPFAHCTQSRLICSATGDEMNEENEPLMLPNGMIYGRLAINLLTENDEIICPRTKEKFHAKDVKRVYVM